MLVLQCTVSISLADHVSAQTPVKDVEGVERASLQGYLEVFRSNPGVSAEVVVEKHAADFQKIPGTLSQGFTSDAVWVSFTLQNKNLT